MTSMYQSLAPAMVPLSHLSSSGYAHLRASIGSARIVMLGEATHGTEEFYRHRAAITQRLLEDDAFDFVAVEGDWPDCYRVNRFIHARPPPLAGGAPPDPTADAALGDFLRFPKWMWRNGAVRDYVDWARAFNDRLAASTGPGRLPVAWYGMDLYSLFTSADAVIRFLERVDPRAADRARERYGTLGQFRHEPQGTLRLPGISHGRSTRPPSAHPLD